jgi:hypothetical protein
MSVTDAFVPWYSQQKAELLSVIKMLESDAMRAHLNPGAGDMDTTQAWIDMFKRRLAENDELLLKYAPEYWYLLPARLA